MPQKNTIIGLIILFHIISIGVITTETQQNSGKTIPSNIDSELRKNIEGLKSPSAEIKVKSALALGMMGERAAPAIPFLIDILGDNTDVFKEEESGLHLWESPVIQVWEAAVDTLGKIGVGAIQPLYLIVTGNDNNHKSHAARALGWIDDQQATDCLIRALKKEMRFYMH